MKWGTFGLVHILSLLAGAGMVTGLYFILRNRSRGLQTAVLGVLSFSGIGAIVYNLLMWGSPLEYLPLHLCSFNALVLPAVVFSRNKTLGNLLLVWSLGALAALVCNFDMAEAELLGWPFVFYYFPHVMEFGIPILLFSLGHVKKDPRCILSTLGITMAVYTATHFVNLLINAGGRVTVNYMYSLVPANPLLALFYSVIPVQYWYMYMIVPILAVYLGILYLPQLLKARKK